MTSKNPLKTGKHGTPHALVVPRNAEGEPTFPLVVVCSEGQRFKVDLPEGSEEDIAAGRTITPSVTPVRDLAPGSFNTSALDENAGVVIRFGRGAGRFGFDYGTEDWYQQAFLIRDDFYPMWGTNYVAPWKLIPTGESDVVEARIDTGSADPNNIFFVLTDGTGVPARKESHRWVLTLPATGHNQHYEVYAVYRRNNQNHTVGKLRVVSYRQQDHTVTLVNVNAQIQEQERARIERELNEIYNQYGVTITVRTDNSIYGNMDWDLDQDSKLNVSGSGFFTRETEEMRALRWVFQQTDNYDSYSHYIFILQRANAVGEPDEDLAVMGDMPRGQRFGYVFMDAVSRDELSWLIAHELGHGIFTLRHTFIANYGGRASKRETNNLMDYNRGTELAAFQWNIMSNPARVTWFDREESAQVLDGMLSRIPTREDLAAVVMATVRNPNLSSDYRRAVFGVFHPIAATRIWLPSQIITDNQINTIASNFELNIARHSGAEFPYGEEGDIGNALRHAIWQAIITHQFGELIAKMVGYAHEENPTADLSQRTFSTLEAADEVVDLLNNIIGREIGGRSIFSEASNRTLVSAVLREFHTNGLWIASPNEDGPGYTIYRHRITDRQFNASINYVTNSLRDNGRAI